MARVLTPEQKAAKVEYNRAWRKSSFENWRKSRESSDRWRDNNRDKYNAYRRGWRAKRKDLMKVQNRRHALKRDFGITLEEFMKMNQAQAGLCAICGGPPVSKENLSVDHNHVTGMNRGLLCGPCNFALNRVERDPGWGEKALSYLNRYKGVTL